MTKQERVARALANPAYFHVAYIAPYDPNWQRIEDPVTGNVRLGPVPGFAQAMLAHAVTRERSVIMLAPEHLKTTILSQTLPIWLTLRAAYFRTQLRGMLLSEEEAMAKANLTVIKWHLEGNERLLRDFSDDQGRPLVYPSPSENVWRDDAIVIDRPHVTRDPTWQAKGLDSKGIHGRRLDWFIGDDVVTPANATSAALRKKALDTMELVVEQRLVEGARGILCGNFNDPEDLLSVKARSPRWDLFKRPTMHLPGKPSVAPKESQFAQASTQWPENWTLARCMKEYRDKPNRFKRVHLFDPRAEWGERLNIGWVTKIDPEQTPFEYCRFFMAVDPASGGEGDNLDYFNITVGARHGQHLDVVQTLDVRCGLPRQAALVGTVHDAFQRIGGGVVAIGIAKIALDRYFGGGLEILRPDLKHKVVPVSIPGDKETRLEGLGPYAQSGWLRVWDAMWTIKTSDPQDQHQEVALNDQWRDFPFTLHDDKLDGLDVMIRTAQEFALVGDAEWNMEVVE